MISQALGVRLYRVHHAKTDLGGGDLVILATDGVADVMGEELLRALAWKTEACSTEGVRRYASEVVDAAVESGSKGNATPAALCLTL